MAGDEPVGDHEPVVAQLASADRTSARARIDRRVAADELGVLDSEPLDLRRVVALGDEVAPGEDRRGVERCPGSSAPRCAGRPPRAPARAASSSSACTPSTSTRRRRGAARRAVSSASRSSRRRAPTKCSPVDPPPRTTTCNATASPFAFRNALATFAADCLSTYHGLVHRDDRGLRQLRRHRVDRARELRAERRRDRRLDDRCDVLEARHVLRVGEHRVLRAPCRAAGRSRTRRRRAPCPRRAPRTPRSRRAGRTSRS